MIRIITNPNLPCGKVKHCLIGGRYKEEISELTELGVECIPLKENPLLDKEISAHADILSYNLGCGKILADKNAIGEEQLLRLGNFLSVPKRCAPECCANRRLHNL